MLDTELIHISFQSQVRLLEKEKRIILSKQERHFALDDPNAYVNQLMKLLSNKIYTLAMLQKEIVTENLSVKEMIQLKTLLFQMSAEGFLDYYLIENNITLAKLTPMKTGLENWINLTHHNYKLSRFVYLRTIEGGWLLESPLTTFKMWLDNPQAVSFIMAFSKPTKLLDITQQFPAISYRSQEILLKMMATANFLDVMTVSESQEEFMALNHWEFHDLLFHTRNRLGRHDYDWGGTFRFYNKIVPLPVTKSTMSAETISLLKFNTKFPQDPQFQQVLEDRKTIRQSSESPITFSKLSEFLYRSARIKSCYRGGSDKNHYPASNRPYPGGGAIYELEIYLIIHRCENLNAGFYHYDPEKHQLEVLPHDNNKLTHILTKATQYSNYIGMPDVMLIITSRFRRMSWKYQSIAYANILKDVGVLYAYFYLIATAMDLAPCALGGGDSDYFASMANLDYYEEGVVGEFLLSSRE